MRTYCLAWPSLLLCLSSPALSGCKEAAPDTAPALATLATSTDEERSPLAESPDYDSAFPQDRVGRIDLTIHPSDWRVLQENLREREAVHIPCTVEQGGKKWRHVEVFAPRGSSLQSTLRAGVGKLPLELRFDDQRYYGFRTLSLGNGAGDPSLIRQRLAGEIFRDQNVHSPRSAFYRLHVDTGHGSIYFGLYTVVEVPDAPMLAVRFGNSDGNLYRAEGEAATLRFFAERAFVKETNRPAHDFSDVQKIISALNASRADKLAWRMALEQVFDVYGFLNWLAVNTVVENWDAYGTVAHYYLYGDTKEHGLLSWIPWDSSQALRPGPGGSLSLSLKEVSAEWPLIRYLMDDPVYSDEYYRCVAAVAQASFSVAELDPLYRSMHALVAPHVTGPKGEVRGYTFLRDPAAFERSVDDLVDQVNRRQEAVKQALATR